MDHNTDVAVWVVWQQQEGEDPPTAIDQIRAKAERLDTKRRRWATFTVLRPAV